ncbi:MAG: hypothetical protein M1274_11155 [Actinobacteria bacterium]|nr:hypothetical protein [Actinomycetota bacterium]
MLEYLGSHRNEYEGVTLDGTSVFDASSGLRHIRAAGNWRSGLSCAMQKTTASVTGMIFEDVKVTGCGLENVGSDTFVVGAQYGGVSILGYANDGTYMGETFDGIFACGNFTYGIGVLGCSRSLFKNITANRSGHGTIGCGIYLAAGATDNIWQNVSAKNNSANGITQGWASGISYPYKGFVRNIFRNVDLTGAGNWGAVAYVGELILQKLTSDKAGVAGSFGSGCQVFNGYVDGNDVVVSFPNYTATLQNDVDYDGGYCWKLAVASATTLGAVNPARILLAVVPVQSGVTKTVKYWARRDDGTLNVRLKCPGLQIAGVDADVADSMTVGANTWEELSIDITPSADGVVEIFGEAWGVASKLAYFDKYH